MAQIISGNTIKLNNGKTVTGQEGGWYDGQQLFKGTLSNPGQINANSNQQGAGQNVSAEVVKQTNPNNLSYIQEQQQKAGTPVTPSSGNPVANPAVPGGGGATDLSGLTTTQTPVLDLPSMYQNLYNSAGIIDLEKQLAEKQQRASDVKAKINDNPWLSEGTRVGRVAKFDQLANDTLKNIQDQIATKKADIETKLNIETKQFDINSQAAQQSLERFNTLLSMGALDSATGEDIAAITRATGLSSQAIQSAVNANKAKNVQTSVMQYDDGTNQGYMVVNTKTGDIINKQVIAASKPKATGGTSVSAQKDRDAATNQSNLASDVKRGATLQQVVAHYLVPGSGLTVEDIYGLYNSNSPRGIAKESLNQVKQGIYATSKGFVAETKKK